MTYVLSRVTPPAKDPVSLREVRNQLRIDGDERDEYLDQLVGRAVEYYDGPHGYLGQCIITQTWKLTTDSFLGLKIPMPNVQSVTTLQYYDTSNVLQAFSDFTIAPMGEDTLFLLNSGASWPSIYARPDAVQVTFVAGYGDSPEDVPPNVRGDILVFITQMEQSPDKDVRPPSFMSQSQRLARARF